MTLGCFEVNYTFFYMMSVMFWEAPLGFCRIAWVSVLFLCVHTCVHVSHTGRMYSVRGACIPYGNFGNTENIANTGYVF